MDAEAAKREQTYKQRVAAATEQVIVAAAVAQHTNDLQQLGPMLTTLTITLTSAGIRDRPEVLLADSGYWSIAKTSPDVLAATAPMR